MVASDLGPFQSGQQAALSESLKPWIDPSWSGSFPRGLHRGDTERLGGETEGSRGCRGNEMSWLAALFARDHGSTGLEKLYAHCCPWWKCGWRLSLAGTFC